MATKKQPEREPTDAERLAEFLTDVEEVWRYLYGLADGLESAANPQWKGMVHRLRNNAHVLSDGVMYVKHGYKEPRP